MGSGAQCDRGRFQFAIGAGPLPQALEATRCCRKPGHADSTMCQQLRITRRVPHRPARKRPPCATGAAQHLQLAVAARIDDALVHRIDTVLRAFQVLQETAAIEHQHTGDTGTVECRGIGQQAVKIGCLQIGAASLA